MYGILPENNEDHHIVKPPFLVDEVSDTEYYIGTSRNFSDQLRPTWRIQKIWKNGSVWYFEYPDGKQSFEFQWALRFTYTYAQ